MMLHQNLILLSVATRHPSAVDKEKSISKQTLYFIIQVWKCFDLFFSWLIHSILTNYYVADCTEGEVCSLAHNTLISRSGFCKSIFTNFLGLQESSFTKLIYLWITLEYGFFLEAKLKDVFYGFQLFLKAACLIVMHHTTIFNQLGSRPAWVQTVRFEHLQLVWVQAWGFCQVFTLSFITNWSSCLVWVYVEKLSSGFSI